ncbi:MAG: 2Fe-2S iron-sulfur cluster-binding protein [Bacillota bacterium]
MKIYINEKEFEIEKQSSLKDILEKEGLYFPCGGQKKCGKCKIECKELIPTQADRRFLTQNQIDKGIRIACDKIAKENIKIYFEKSKKPAARKLEYCNILIDIDTQTITIGILEDELVEIVKVENNIEKAKNKTYSLRSVVAKESIELFEKYSVAKADTFALSCDRYYSELLTQKPMENGGEVLDALDYMLPGESLYILPFVKNTCAKILTAALAKTFPLVVMDCQDTFTLALIDEEENYIIRHKNVSYQKEELVALRTSLDYLLEKIQRPPIINLYGNYSKAMEDVLDDMSYAVEESSLFEVMAGKIFNNRMRAKLFRVANKTSLLTPLQTDKWQELFLSANNRYNSH